MAANNRIYYAIQQVAFSKDSSGLIAAGTNSGTAAHGVQSVGITTTFNLEQVFELGQLAIYENVEGTPDIEVTMSKVLDGYIPLWCLATSDQSDGPQLAKRCTSANKCQVHLGIYDEALEAAGQTGKQASTFVSMSGLYPTSITYNFPVDDNFSEDITLVGNTKIWGTGQTTSTLSCEPKWYPNAVSGQFSGNNDSPIGSGGVNRRQNFLFATGEAGKTTAVSVYDQCIKPDLTVLPADIPGVLSFTGESPGYAGKACSSGVKSPACHIQSMTASVDVAREELFELGSKVAYARPVTFPVEVTCDFEVTSASGDLINAIDACSGAEQNCEEADSLSHRAIRIAVCEGLRIWLGRKNKLASVTYGGGDAGGGNATVTYSYTTFNDFTVLHYADEFTSGGSPKGRDWWTNRAHYIGTGVSSPTSPWFLL